MEIGFFRSRSATIDKERDLPFLASLKKRIMTNYYQSSCSVNVNGIIHVRRFVGVKQFAIYYYY